MPITALYAGLLAPLFIFLSVRVIGVRRTARIAIGHGDDEKLLRRMRVQANFAEYAPLGLVLLALAESVSTAPLILHAIGMALLAGRYIHAFGVSQTPERLSFRVTGMAATFTALGCAAAACLVMSLDRLL